VILGTAGHIDHGKTALVRALTGVDTDRLPEEKRRGITIELGFAPLELEGVGTIGVVDVPGHEAFVRTMLAGATGVDLALVVIAADEGIMPQSREHVSILSLLGVRAGVIALSKSDLADPDWMQLVEEDVRTLMTGSDLAGAEIVRCSAKTGAGIPELRAALIRAAQSVPARSANDLFRMPLDRAFSVKGTGTVVTGTVWSGRVRPDDAVVLLPAGRSARVRGVESHGRARSEATSGERTAVALAGIDRAEIEPRGTMLVTEGEPWVTSRLLRADVALLEGAPVLGPRTRVRFHLGTAELGARLIAVGAPVTPGRRVPVRISLDSPVAARAGDRFVLRSAAPAATIGGGVITDPAPPLRRVKPWPSSGADAAQRLEWILAEVAGKGVAYRSLSARLGLRPNDVDAFVASLKRVVRAGERLFPKAAADAASKEIVRAVNTAHRERPLDPGAPIQSIRAKVGIAPELLEHLVASLVAAGTVTQRDGFVANAGWNAGAAAAEDKRIKAVLEELVRAGRTPPSVDEMAASHGPDVAAVLKLLGRRGEVVQVATDRYFSTQAVAELTGVVTSALAGGGALTTSELREKTGLTRKFVIPFLEFCDRIGVTARRGDVRVLGTPQRTAPGVEKGE
jgi:selenocysteine-specific elongation factor